MNPTADRPFYYNHIYLDPNVASRLYVLEVPARVSEDGGKTFPRNLPGIEGDFHAMWIDPSNSDRFYIGNDKGASVTYDGGRNFIMFDNMDIGQFYAITADNRDPYWRVRRPAGQRQLGRADRTAATTTASSATTGSSSIPATGSTRPWIRTTGASSTPRRRTAAFAGSTRRSASRARA